MWDLLPWLSRKFFKSRYPWSSSNASAVVFDVISPEAITLEEATCWTGTSPSEIWLESRTVLLSPQVSTLGTPDEFATDLEKSCRSGGAFLNIKTSAPTAASADFLVAYEPPPGSSGSHKGTFCSKDSGLGSSKMISFRLVKRTRRVWKQQIT